MKLSHLLSQEKGIGNNTVMTLHIQAQIYIPGVSDGGCDAMEVGEVTIAVVIELVAEAGENRTRNRTLPCYPAQAPMALIVHPLILGRWALTM